MSFRYSENELDNSLFAEFAKSEPNENYVRELIAKGANINAIDCKSDSVLIDAISNIQDGLDLKFIRLILDLGADVNYADEGFNCLFNACLTCNLELVEMLLIAGANPNCISENPTESLLDWAEFDQWYEEDSAEWLENNNYIGVGADENINRAELMKGIIELLKKYGAKPLSKMYTDKIEKFVEVFATSDSGLSTASGNITIGDIPGVDVSFIEAFNEWKINNPDTLSKYERDYVGKITNPPDLKLLKQHNEQGLSIAQKIKQQIGEEMTVNFSFISPEYFEKHGTRYVETVEIK